MSVGVVIFPARAIAYMSRNDLEAKRSKFSRNGHQLAILGEKGKWAPISPQRIKAVEFVADDVYVYVEGAPGEVRIIYFPQLIQTWLDFMECTHDVYLEHPIWVLRPLRRRRWQCSLRLLRCW